MTITAPTIRFREVSTPWNTFSRHTQRCWNRCVTIYRSHSDLVSGLGLFTLNTSILASRIFKQIPSFVQRSAFTALNFTGLIWMNMQIRDLGKSGEDLWFNLRAGDGEGIVFTAAKVVVKSLNILLTGSMLAASIASLCSYPQIALSMYTIMRPFALFSLYVGIGTQIYDDRKNKALHRQLTHIEDQPDKVRAVMTCFLKRLYKESPTVVESREHRLAYHTFNQLDHHSMEALIEGFQKKYAAENSEKLMNILSQETINEHFHQLRNALNQKTQFTQANLGLLALGYACMAVCRMWPDSLIQSSVTWGMSLLYTSKLIWQKYLQSEWNARVLEAN
jgi:hypothetical protein